MRTFCLILISLLSTNSSYAFEISESVWRSTQAFIHIGINGSSPSGDTWNAAITRAMDNWSDVNAFQFVAVDDYLDPCIDRGPGEFGDGLSGVDFSATVCGAEFNESTLAVTRTSGPCLNSNCTSGFTITEADIVFRSDADWDIYSGPRRFDNSTDFERVALHELGHALGLDHSDATDAIMRPFVSDTDSLQADDIAAVVSIYGGGGIAGTTVANIYGVALLAPNDSTVSGPSNSNNLSGTLGSGDNQLEGKPLDLYQYTFENDSSIEIQLNAEAFDPFLYLVRVSATQSAVPDYTFFDDNGGPGNNARIVEQIQAGTYWLGVTSTHSSALGGYNVSIESSTSAPSSSFESFTSVYGVDVLVNPNPSIGGSLGLGDAVFDERFLDLVQFEVAATSTVRIDLRSANFDTNLLLVDILNQQVGTLLLQDDDGGSNTNSRIETTLLPGTYWLGVTSFAASETGAYDIDISLVLP
ncbi:MAG: matrixin family metalloprotease [Pseudohongiellaceae bacterium]